MPHQCSGYLFHIWWSEISNMGLAVDVCNLVYANFDAAIITCMKFIKMAVAIDQHNGFKPFVRPPRCKLQSYSHLDYTRLDFTQTNLTNSCKNAFELPNFQRSFSTPCLSLATNMDEDLDHNPRIEIVGGHGAPRVRALVVEVAIALASGVNVEPVSSGLGGAYFLCAKNGNNIAVVKPIDEEPLAFNNPKGFTGRMLGQPGIKRSIRVGETGLRELAAFLLDHGGFAGVPPTALVKISHVTFHVSANAESLLAPPTNYKIASLQRFIDHDSDAGDLGPSGFSVASIHHIGILDIRLLNLDRHAGNILVKCGHENYAVGAVELVPIDHGLCLPESLDDPYFEWLHWPQASIPFSESEVEYISNLDPYKDAELLRTQIPSIRESSIRILVLCTVFLKRAAAAGLCLADIAEMMTREFCGGEENWSALESLCVNAKASFASKESTNKGKVYSDHDEEEVEMFQFDSDSEDGSNQVLAIPQLLQGPPLVGKPPKIPRYLSVRSMSHLDDVVLPLSHDDYSLNNVVEVESDDDDSSSDDNQKAGLFFRTLSFSGHKYKTDSEGISFKDMNEDEWELFLVCFEELLPEAFEGRKSMGLLKQRFEDGFPRDHVQGTGPWLEYLEDAIRSLPI
ncbi:hypothetical protein RJ640_012643 [Escallonia rubra]|uniref:1-phosphatidylinositol 4-kinase n=1 Tax=Escallonia rubra TaxID=112253 RepID=A0AA88U694_9ASTE|nr:hypothetical protein RJ640_012643 [Escallonia rubra]